MLNLSETILSTYKMRRTKNQKSAFIKLMQSYYHGLCIEETGKRKSRNLILGDIGSASVILTAHYDTSAASLFPNIVMPYRKVLRFIYTMLSLLPIILLSFGAMLLTVHMGASNSVMLLCFLLVYYALFFVKMFLLPPNSSNDNDNTSGVVTLIEIWERLPDADRAQTALIFFDNEEYGCVGSKDFYNSHKDLMENKLLLNFDCVGDGDTFLLVLPERAEKLYKPQLAASLTAGEGKRVVFDSRKRANHSSDHKHFPCGVAVAAMHESRLLRLYLGRIHTRRDTVLDRTNISFLTDRIAALIRRING